MRRIANPPYALTFVINAAVLIVLMALAMVPAVAGADQQNDSTKDTTKVTVADSTRDTLPGPDEFVPVDSLPDMVQAQRPVYPREAKVKEQTGTAWVKALVGTDGKVYSVRLAKTSKVRILDESAMSAAFGCVYKPAKKDGKPVACWVTYKIEFKTSKG